MTIDETIRAAIREELRRELPGLVRDAIKGVPQPAPPPAKQSDTLTPAEAAKEAKVSVVTIRTWIKEGHLPAKRPKGSRLWRIHRDDLAKHLAGSKVAPAPREVDIDALAAKVVSGRFGR